jgi:uracil-DNA glycosylase
VSDARERLRQYLEQRRELGESEFVLDSLSVDDALRVLTTGAPPPPVPPRGSGATGPRVDRPVPTAPDSAMRRAAEDAARSGDWREALRAVDAADPDRTAVKAPRGASRGTSAEPGRPAGAPPGEPAAAAAEAAEATDPEAGLVVGEHAPPSGLAHLATLDDVAAAVEACTACELGARALHPVPGEGSPAAQFVVVGEAPGAKEDELGRPFVGKSGELLTKILDAIGFQREDVFICNVLKHRPPGNRNPNAAEIAACRPFLFGS